MPNKTDDDAKQADLTQGGESGDGSLTHAAAADFWLHTSVPVDLRQPITVKLAAGW